MFEPGPNITGKPVHEWGVPNSEAVASPAIRKNDWENSFERAELIDSNVHLRGQVEQLLEVLRRIAAGYVVPGTDALHINHPSVAEAAGAIIAAEVQLAKTNHKIR